MSNQSIKVEIHPMTQKEKDEYNRLPFEFRKFYDMMKERHPDWIHAQLITVVWQKLH